MKVGYNIKKHIALTAAVTLTVGSMAGFSGCGREKETGKETSTDVELKKGEKEEQAMGRYLEENLTLPEDCENLESLRMLTNGTLRVCYRNKDYQLCLADSGDRGKNWGETKRIQEILGMGDTGSSIGYPALGDDGSMFFYQSLMNEDGTEIEDVEYYYVSPEGKVKKLDKEKIGKDFGYRACFTEKGTLILGRLSDGLVEIDPEADSILHEYEKGSSINYFYATGKQLMSIGSDFVHYFELETGEPLKDQEALTRQLASNKANMEVYSLSSSSVVVTAAGDDSLFYIDSSGAFRYVYGGSVVEQIIDGSLNSLGSPDTALVGMDTDEEGNIYLAATDAEGSRLFRYSYSKDVPAVPDTELTVYSLKENKLIRQAAALFQKKYPNIYINLETGMTGEDAVTATDALKTLNTEIMAEKGPDVLLLDGISQDTYIEKGILADMREILERLGDSGEILENIKNAYTQEDGSVYCLPLRFGIPILETKEEEIDKITDLKTLADEVEAHKGEYSQTSFPMYDVISPKLLLNRLADVSSPAWVKEDGTLDEKKVSEFLEQANRIYQSCKPVLDEMKEMTEDYEQQTQNYNRTDYSIGMGAMGILSGTEHFGFGALYNPFDLQSVYSVEKKDASFAHKAFGGQEEKVFIPTSVIGISTKAQEKEAAETFVGFLLSQEAQATSNFNTGGLPVNKKAYESESLWMDGNEEDKVLSVSSSSRVGEDGTTIEEIELEILQPSRESIKEIQEIGKSLTVPARTDEVVLSAVTEAGVRYLKGECQLSEAARDAIQKVNLYLSE